MKRLIIASNRLPIKLNKKDSSLEVIPSEGGLATGLKSYHNKNNSIWIGWPGIYPESKNEERKILSLLKTENYLPVFLSQELIEDYYEGFSNATLWPLFHYFTDRTEYNDTYWRAYRRVNELFAQKIIDNAEENDTVWLHDYQLLLLPDILRKARPDLCIGFFLHIPFPSFEIIRTLPWREQIIAGMLGADLIGFHTYDYARHYISSVKRLLGFEVEFNQVKLGNREVLIDVFPMGIDYQKFESSAYSIQSKAVSERSKEHQDINRFLQVAPERKLILSIDRLDYSKGIPHRLKAFRLFLQKHPEFKEKVSLVMLTVPSRTDIEQYKFLKHEIDELVGNINGEFGSINWNPVIYFYRSLNFENLIELYISSDVALLTPLRDGMNLVAKEYIATKVDQKGVLILSEMAGAAKELSEAIFVNPNNIVNTADAIYKALKVSNKDQKRSITAMQSRLKRYDIHKWASEFLTTLEKTKEMQSDYTAKKISETLIENIFSSFSTAEKKVLFIDYDGTLQPFFNNPQDAYPDKKLYSILDRLANDHQTEVVLISGRDRDTFDQWFGNKNYVMIVEHGSWKKEKSSEWIENKPVYYEWKSKIFPVLESYTDRTPGSFIEEKSHSLVWHYRKADIELGALRALELVHDVSNLIINQDLEILEGKKVVEVKVSGVNKGTAAVEYLRQFKTDFILAIGDDWTDEFLFRELPDSAITIKVGNRKSAAKYYLENYKEVRTFLEQMGKRC